MTAPSTKKPWGTTRKPPGPIRLRPLDSPELLQLVEKWLSQKENYQWLDFGDGRQLVTAEWLKTAMQRGSYVLRLFGSDIDGTPIGVVGLGNINRIFKTANIWVVLGDKSYAGQGYASRAVYAMLTVAFTELALQAVHTWIVEHKQSMRVAERVRFRQIGRQRECHYIDGRAYDRLWFDILAHEHSGGSR